MWIEKGGLIVGMGLGLMSYIQDWLELICMQKADLSIEEGLVLPVQVASGR